jgi:hypothetical protein
LPYKHFLELKKQLKPKFQPSSFTFAENEFLFFAILKKKTKYFETFFEKFRNSRICIYNISKFQLPICFIIFNWKRLKYTISYFVAFVNFLESDAGQRPNGKTCFLAAIFFRQIRYDTKKLVPRQIFARQFFARTVFRPPIFIFQAKRTIFCSDSSSLDNFSPGQFFAQNILRRYNCSSKIVFKQNGQFFNRSILCPLPFALCPLPFALCPLPFALCPLPFALCPLPFALCSLPFAFVLSDNFVPGPFIALTILLALYEDFL